VRSEIDHIVAEELTQKLPQPVTALAARIAEQRGPSVLALLFYGSTLRTGDIESLLDFYVLVDDLKSWQSDAVVWPHLLLPPRVEYLEQDVDGVLLRAKLAILTIAQFERLMRADALNTTVWARFCQPVALAYRRDVVTHERIVSALALAVRSAARWAALLGPTQARAQDFWSALFARSYAAEIRVEMSGRAHDIVAARGARYEQLLPLAWVQENIAFSVEGETLRPSFSPHLRIDALRAWRLRAALAKPLNFMRLIKAAFTFEGAADYAAWKIERHSGVKLELTAWQRQHPILASPPVLWRLWRQGVLR
jgi:hypothetical protein